MDSYNRICAEFYDVDKPEAPKDALAFYLSYARDADGPILEPMCGSGRFLLPMLKAGYDIEGSDASTAMLDRCRNQAKAQGLSPRIHEQYLEKLDLPRKFSLAFIPSGSLGLISNLDTVREGLRRLHQHLLPGGKLVFEVEKYAPHAAFAGTWGGRWVTRKDGAKLLISWLPQSGENDPVSTSLHRYEIYKNGELIDTQLEELTIRTYTLENMTSLLSEAGFQDIKVFRTFEFRPPGPEDVDFVFEACRPS